MTNTNRTDYSFASSLGMPIILSILVPLAVENINVHGGRRDNR